MTNNERLVEVPGKHISETQCLEIVRFLLEDVKYERCEVKTTCRFSHRLTNGCYYFYTNKIAIEKRIKDIAQGIRIAGHTP